MTINEQLIEKFEHEDVKEDLANSVLKAVRPGFELKELIAKEVRNKIVSLFSSREDKLKIDNYNVAELINWESDEEQVVTTTSVNPKIHVKLTQSLRDDDFWDFSYSWQDTDGTQLGKVSGLIFVLQNQEKRVVKASCAHVSDLTPVGWQQLADWLQSEGLKVTLRKVPKAGSFFKNEYGEITIWMNTKNLSSSDEKKR